MSNPYGPPEPGEQQQPYSPYGTNPYGGAPASPYGAPGASQGLDAVSITGFVFSLLCCTGFVGVILGIIGLSRTKNGVRQGRWAAIAAIVIGIVGSLATIASLVFFVWFGTSTVFIDSADVGQCVNVDELGNQDATLWEKDCDESHDAEIAATGTFTSDEVDAYDDNDPAALCADRIRTDYATAYATGDYYLGIVFEASEPDTGDDFVCFLERKDGTDLEQSIG
ncbi:hypothetical protein F0U44_09295 [Nocardioides humilatus]|uniref:DUF4190 domain-containing protein n=1 Tax=Nocardioides humilatus TaxID=2607660 RepID=A0A5B1LD64_9ACTN|nr:hypothetical protein [Nocardioides humilatus]KAA1418681.1 hypothetical protein F0U44_09295 [Nocardioides humilatus]